MNQSNKINQYPLLGEPQQLFEGENVYVIHEKAQIGKMYSFKCPQCHSILSDGSISGCLSIRSQYHQGNIYKDKFTDVWEKQFKPYRNREWMRTEQCVACDMWDFCQGNGMHLRDNEGRLMLCHYRDYTV